MIAGISQESRLTIENPFQAGEATTAVDSLSSFAGQLLAKTNAAQLAADDKINQYTLGEAPLHVAMVSVEKASLAFQFLNQVRNKAIEAYQEVMRMQV